MRKLLGVLLLVGATNTAWGNKTEAPSTGSCTKTVAVAIARSDGIQPLAPDFVIKWWKKESKHHPYVCLSTNAGVGTQNYLLVISSSQSYFNGLMPTTHQETETSRSTSSVSADGTATNSQGESWNYTASGTVDTTTTTTKTVHENVPYTDSDVSLYMQLYDSHGTILQQDSHLYSTRTGGDAADSFGHNLGNALAAIHARAGMLNKMVKVVENQENRRAAELSQYCAAHSGEPWVHRSPAGAVLNSGTCPGEMNQARARKLLIDSFAEGFKENKVAGYAEVVGDNFILHSERASAVRFGMILHDPANQTRLETMKQAGLTTWVYTNDADVNLIYDLKSSQMVTGAASAMTSPTLQTAAPDRPATAVPTAHTVPVIASDRPATLSQPPGSIWEAMSDEEYAHRYASQAWCEADALHGGGAKRNLAWKDGACYAKNYASQSTDPIAATAPTHMAVQATGLDKPVTAIAPAPGAPITESEKPAPIAARDGAEQSSAQDEPATSPTSAAAVQPTASDKPAPAKKEERVCIATMTFANGNEVCTRFAQDIN